MLHVFWSCNKIQPVWTQVKYWNFQFTDIRMPDDMAAFFLHLAPLSSKQYKHSLLMHFLNVTNSYLLEMNIWRLVGFAFGGGGKQATPLFQAGSSAALIAPPSLGGRRRGTDTKPPQEADNTALKTLPGGRRSGTYPI